MTAFIRKLAFLLWLPTFATAGQAVPFVQNSDGVLVFQHAVKQVVDSPSPPAFQQAAGSPLPDLWQHDPEGFYGSVWYRITLPETVRVKGQWAIYLPALNMNAEVWLNGVRLGSGGRMTKPLSRYWHAPLMFVFSPSDLGGQNHLYIRVVAYANEFGSLGRVYVGERDVITGLYRKRFFSTVTVHVIGGVVAGGYALLIALVWWRRRDPVFFWAALVCGVWAVSSMNLYVIDPPLPELTWEKIMQISMGWIPSLFFFFILRLDGIGFRRNIDGVILCLAAVLNLSILLSGEAGLFTLSRAWHGFSMLFGLLGVSRVFYSWFRYRRHSQFVMLLAFLLIALCGLHDMVVQNHLLGIGQVFWLNYSVPVVLLLIGYLMVARFLEAVHTAEQLNVELEDRVRAAHEKIEADYERILMLETEQASHRERETIYRNLHDDMGGKLLSLVYKAESEEMQTLARSAMDDLRAIVSRKTTESSGLAECLARWRTVCQRRCGDAALACSWQQGRIARDLVVSAEQERHLTRVLSEAITNVVKHGNGSRLLVDIRVRANCLRVRLLDDSVTEVMGEWTEGRGMSSMRLRIRQLRGRIVWRRCGEGVEVRWIVPLETVSMQKTVMEKTG